MITAQHLCRDIIDEFEKKELRKVRECDSFNSSIVAVSLDYLNEIKDTEIKEYAKGRDGLIYITKEYTFSLRDMLKLLESHQKTKV